MVDNKLIAAIIMRFITPSTDLMKPNDRTGYYDFEDLARVSPIAVQALRMWEAMTKLIPETQQTPNLDNLTDLKGVETMAGDEIIAAFITAGMLPKLPPAKLRDLARGSRTDVVRRSVELVASALTLYGAVLEMVKAQHEGEQDGESIH